MSLTLPTSILNIFQKKKTNFSAGISILPDKVQLVKVESVNGSMQCVGFDVVSTTTDEQAITALETLINKHQLVSAETTIILPANKVESTQLDTSELPDREVTATLPWKIKELINIAPQDMVCDYIDMPLQPTGQQPKTQVLAVSRTYLERVIKPFHDAGAPIHALTTEQFALAKLQTTQDAAQLIFIQHHKSDAILLIVKNQQICFARKIRNTAATIDMTPEQLQMGGSDMIAIEIQRSIDYFESQLKQPPIKNAFLAMEGNNADLLVDALNQVLPVKTKLIPLDNLDGQSDLDSSYIAAVGAALYSQPLKNAVEAKNEN